MAQFTEDEKIMRRLEQRFNKGVVKYRLIEDGDKIFDSSFWWKGFFGSIGVIGKAFTYFETEICSDSCACSMTNIPYQSDLEYLKGYSEDLGVPFVHYETFF